VGPVKLSAKAGNQLLEVTVERENGRYMVRVDGVPHLVDAHKLEGDFYSIVSGGRSYEVSVEADGDGYRVRHGAAEQLVTITDPGRRARESLDGGEGPAQITTAMPGKVVRVLVAEGDAVEAGQGLIVVEAMKMENEIASPKAGSVESIKVQPGQAVEGGALLAVVD
jgi:biotin carboxyl carrier protein